jgi:hypothetical protein
MKFQFQCQATNYKQTIERPVFIEHEPGWFQNHRHISFLQKIPVIIKNKDNLKNTQRLISSITERHYIWIKKSKWLRMVEKIIAVFMRSISNGTGLEHFVSKILDFQF